MEFTKRQIEIIKSATKLIGFKGIQNLTTKNLAEDMGFSEPALYRHFKNKTEILQSVLEFYRTQLKDNLGGLFGEKLSGIVKLKKIMDFQFNHLSKNPAIIMVVFSETSFQFDKKLSIIVSKIMEQKKKYLIRIIEAGQEEGNIRDDLSAEQIAVIIMGSMRFKVLQWRISKFEFDLVDHGRELRESIFLMIKKD